MQSIQRYKIDTLIALARLTEDQEKRTQYTDEVERLLMELDASRFARETPVTDEAESFIISYLEEHGGGCEVKDLDNAAAACGIKNNAIKTAKQRLKTAGRIKIESTSQGQSKGFAWRVFLHPCSR